MSAQWRKVIPANSSLIPVPSGLLQRKCACGSYTMAGGECEECGRKKRLGLQTKLKVNEPGDSYERKADWVADRVMRMSEGEVAQRNSVGVQHHAAYGSAGAGFAPPIVHEVLSSSDQPLNAATRAFFEPRFGYDFGAVRVHTNAEAREYARAVNALAYTVGPDVSFGMGQYAPDSMQGRHLMAHELVHVVQQSGTLGPIRGNGSPIGLLIQRQESSIDGRIGVDGRMGTEGKNVTEGEKKENVSPCPSWFGDPESISKRAAEHYVRTELKSTPGTAEKIECELPNPLGNYACIVRFSDGRVIRVIVRKQDIVVGVPPINTLTPPRDRPLCFYDYRCPAGELILTRRECKSSK